MTHRDALGRREAYVPPSECPGPLVFRRLRRGDRARVCRSCGMILGFDPEGRVVWSTQGPPPRDRADW